MTASIDYSAIQPGSVQISQDQIAQERERAAGYKLAGEGAGLWYLLQTGIQRLQLIPFGATKTGTQSWHFQTNFYHHAGFVADDALVKKMKEKFPGWSLICLEKTLKIPCPVCKLKWAYANHLDNDPRYRNRPKKDKFQDPKFKNFGLYQDFRALAFVLVTQSAAAFLDSPAGQQWEATQKRLLANNSKGMEKFLAGVQAARTDAADVNYSEIKARTTMLGSKIHADLLSLANRPGFESVWDPFNGRALSIETTIDPKNPKAHRSHKLNTAAHDSPLVALPEGGPDVPAVQALLSQTWDLTSAFNVPWPDEVARYVNDRVRFLENQLLRTVSPGATISQGPHDPRPVHAHSAHGPGAPAPQYGYAQPPVNPPVAPQPQYPYPQQAPAYTQPPANPQPSPQPPIQRYENPPIPGPSGSRPVPPQVMSTASPYAQQPAPVVAPTPQTPLQAPQSASAPIPDPRAAPPVAQQQPQGSSAPAGDVPGPTAETDANGYPRCFNKGVHNPENPVCNMCQQEVFCDQ